MSRSAMPIGRRKNGDDRQHRPTVSFASAFLPAAQREVERANERSHIVLSLPERAGGQQEEMAELRRAAGLNGPQDCARIAWAPDGNQPGGALTR